MSMTFANQLAIIPALLIALACALLLRYAAPENARQRLLLFLLGLSVILSAAGYIAMRFITEPYNQPFFQLSNLLTPSMLGIMALILMNLKGFTRMGRSAKVAAITLAILLCILFSLTWSNHQTGVAYRILPGMAILAIGWTFGGRSPRLTLALGLLFMALYVYLNWSMTHRVDYSGTPSTQILGTLIFIALFITPSLAMVVAALLIAESFQTVPGDSRTRWVKLLKIGLSLALILGMAYTIFWGSVWDNTSDGLFGIFTVIPSALMAIGAGMVLTLALRGKQRLAGMAFLIVAPLILYQSFEAGWRVSYHEITEGRAKRISLALEQYHAREGSYPETLGALTPRDLLFIQQPVILAGEQWCYESGGNYYRLSAFYREFFSSPVSLRVYDSAGDVPSTPPICEERLAEMKNKYYSPMEDSNAMRPPVPTPLPDIEVGIPKTEIYPLLNGSVALPGSWSPDGRYFLFGTQKDGLELHFVVGETGDVCTADVKFTGALDIRENSAWLPDGRLLYAESSGKMTLLSPCELGSEYLTLYLPETFDRIMKTSKKSGRILLEGESAFWILDGRTLELTRVPDVTPNPYEFHWDTSAWLADGEQLVIGRLNGRKGSNRGATLYLLDGKTGEALNTLELKGEFEQSAPWIEALIEEKALYQTRGELLLADFGVQPVSSISVMKDIFGLNVNIFDDVSAWGSYVNSDDSGYYLFARLNHPRNQSTYLYDSRTGQVYVYNHEYHSLLLFPDGTSVDMQKLETVPTYRDEYDIIMADAPEIIYPRVSITGHTPREYPSLNIKYLPKQAQLAAASAHGVSLVSLSNGEMLAYWSLAGEGYSPWIIPSPDGSALIASKDFGGLYYIPLP